MWNSKKYKFQIQSSEICDMGVFEGEYIDTYNDFKPILEIPNELKLTTKEIIFKWVNTPPKLPNNSKQINKLPEDLSKKLKDLTQKFNFYQKGKQYYLLYREGDNLKELRKISELANFKIVIR